MPGNNGRYGKYGGRFVPETIMPALIELEEFYGSVKKRPLFPAGIKLLF